MSKIERGLCSLFLKDNFGEIVQQVGDYILKSGSKPLHLIKSETKLPIAKVKQALCVLIQHNLCTFHVNEKHRYIEYNVPADRVLLCTRYCRYIFCIKTLYGDVAELIVEEIIENGQLTLEKIISNVVERINETSSEDQTNVTPSCVLEQFTNLVNTHFVQQCPSIIPGTDNANKLIPTFSPDDQPSYQIPHVDLQSLSRKRNASGEAEDEPAKKRLKTENLSDNQNKIYWRINFHRFHDYFRDELVIKAVSNKLGSKTGQVYQAVFKVLETKQALAPISKQEIFQYLSKNNSNISFQEVEHHLAVLVDDNECGFVKAGESGGGMYTVYFNKVIYHLLVGTMQSIVQERFGSQSARIFRLVLLKNYLEQKQIEELAMIPAKEAKEMTYKMFQENFLQVQEIPRTPDYAPSRTFYLFHVNLLQLARMILERTYKSLTNAIIRREMVLKDNKRLLDKKQRVDAIIVSLKQTGGDQAQLKEVEENITGPEQAMISKTNQTTDKLEQSELQMDETIFIMQLALKYEAFKL